MKMVMTGAAGSIGQAVLPLLTQHGHEVTCLDLTAPAGSSGTWITGSVTDRAALEQAFAGAELVFHLAGHPREHTWEEIVAVNINGTHAVFDTAHRMGISRVAIASSVHAAGYVPLAEAATTVADIRPDTYYGVGKVTGEALGSLYADRFAMQVLSARIMTFGEYPRTSRALSTWLSPADLVRLIDAFASTELPGHHVVWGVSNNTRRLVPLDPGHRIGYFPEDDSEAWADRVSEDAEFEVLGGPFTDDAHPMGRPWS